MSLQSKYIRDLNDSLIKKESYHLNKPFEQNIKAKILSELNINNDILFADFVNQDFDFVVVTRANDYLQVYYMPEAKLDLLTKCDLKLLDTGDKYKRYYRVNISILPPKLQKLIRFHNAGTSKDLIVAHRFIMSLYCNITSLEVHHLTPLRFNPQGRLERLEPNLNINDLLPVGEPLHELFHTYLMCDCNTPQEIADLESKIRELKEVLKVFKYGNESTLEYKSNPELLSNILLDSKKLPLIKIAEKYNLSFVTVSKLVNTYTHLIEWC